MHGWVSFQPGGQGQPVDPGCGCVADNRIGEELCIRAAVLNQRRFVPEWHAYGPARHNQVSTAQAIPSQPFRQPPWQGEGHCQIGRKRMRSGRHPSIRHRNRAMCRRYPQASNGLKQELWVLPWTSADGSQRHIVQLRLTCVLVGGSGTPPAQTVPASRPRL